MDLSVQNGALKVLLICEANHESTMDAGPALHICSGDLLVQPRPERQVAPKTKESARRACLTA